MGQCYWDASMTADDTVLEARIEALDRRVTERVAEMDALRRENKAEFERRLDALNHEAEQLKSMQSTYLPREVFETTKMTGSQNRALMVSAVVAALISAVISVALELFTHH